MTFFETSGSTIVSKLTSELAATRNGIFSVSLVEPQLPTWLHAVAWIVYGPLRPASGILAISCPLLANVVGICVQLVVPCGAISICPPATCDSSSLVLTTTCAGLLGSWAAMDSEGFCSSMSIVIDELPAFGWPCGSIA